MYELRFKIQDILSKYFNGYVRIHDCLEEILEVVEQHIQETVDFNKKRKK